MPYHESAASEPVAARVANEARDTARCGGMWNRGTMGKEGRLARRDDPSVLPSNRRRRLRNQQVRSTCIPAMAQHPPRELPPLGTTTQSGTPGPGCGSNRRRIDSPLRLATVGIPSKRRDGRASLSRLPTIGRPASIASTPTLESDVAWSGSHGASAFPPDAVPSFWGEEASSDICAPDPPNSVALLTARADRPPEKQECPKPKHAPSPGPCNSSLEAIGGRARCI